MVDGFQEKTVACNNFIIHDIRVTNHAITTATTTTCNNFIIHDIIPVVTNHAITTATTATATQ